MPHVEPTRHFVRSRSERATGARSSGPGNHRPTSNCWHSIGPELDEARTTCAVDTPARRPARDSRMRELLKVRSQAMLDVRRRVARDRLVDLFGGAIQPPAVERPLLIETFDEPEQRPLQQP